MIKLGKSYRFIAIILSFAMLIGALNNITVSAEVGNVADKFNVAEEKSYGDANTDLITAWPSINVKQQNNLEQNNLVKSNIEKSNIVKSNLAKVEMKNSYFSDENGAKKSSIEGLKTFNFTADIFGGANDVNAQLIVSVLDKNGKLKCFNQKEVLLKATTNTNININAVNTHIAYGDYAKVMLWENMSPLTDVVTSSVGEAAYLEGLFETHQTITAKYIKFQDEITTIKWLVSPTKNGEYSIVNGNFDKFYIEEQYANKWIKAEIKQGENLLKTNPEQIGELWTTRQAPRSGDTRLQNVLDKSPATNLFTVDGVEYILLDTTKSDASRYLIMRRNAAAYRKYADNAGQEFTALSSWLNNEFLTTNPISPNIVQRINKNAIWKLDPLMYPQIPVTNERVITAGVTIPSIHEVIKYKDKIGLYEESKGWWTRTPQGTVGDGNAILATNDDAPNMGCFFPINSNSANLGIRPMFYVDKDFFATVKVDIATMGDNVKNVIATAHTPQELGIYTADELNNLYSQKNIKAEIKNVYGTNETVDVHFNVTEITTAQYKFELYCDGVLVEAKEFSVKNKYDKIQSIALGNVKSGVHKFRVAVYRNNSVIKDIAEDTAVMDLYTPQFMDDISLKGYSTNISDVRDVELAVKSGVKVARGSMEWNSVEQSKGVYDFTEFDKIMLPLIENNIEPIILLCYNNPLYNGETEIMARQYGHKNKVEIDAFARYAVAVAKHYSTVKYFEVYNEPNIGFWKPTPNYKNYSYLCQVTEREIKKVNPNATILGGAVASGDAKFVENMYENNVYPYIDAISYHPYIYFDGSNVDDGYQAMIDSIHEKTNKMGGFKEQIITEVGWPTHTGGVDSSTEMGQAAELMKQFVVAQANGVKINTAYNFINSGENSSYNEDNFGVVTAKRRPKPAYVANATLMNKTAGALYIGEATVKENVKSFIYAKNGKPFMIMWHNYPKNSADISDTVNLVGENVTVYDMFGNIVGENVSSVTLNNDPVYVHNLSDKWLNKAVSKTINAEVSTMLTQIGLMDKQSYFNGILTSATNLGSSQNLLTDAQTVEKINEVYAVGSRLISDFNTLNISKKQLSSLLNIVQKIGGIWGNYYANVVSPGEIVTIDAMTHIESGKNKVKAKENSVKGGKLVYSSSMLTMANEFLDVATRAKNSVIDNVSRSGFVKSNNKIANELCKMSMEMLKIEDVTTNNIVLQAPSENAVVRFNTPSAAKVSVYNYGKDGINGQLQIRDTDNKVVGETAVSVGAGENKDVQVTVNVATNKDYSSDLMVAIVEGGRDIASNLVPLMMQNPPIVPTNDTSKFVENTPLENVFTVDGQEFILLKTENDPNSKYFCVAKDFYGSTRAFESWQTEPSQRFDISSSKNIGYWLNNTFTSADYVDKKLPNSILQHIDKNHVWRTEAASHNGNADYEYNVKSGISVLSYSEFLEHSTKIGTKDGFNFGGNMNRQHWWLRTGYGAGNTFHEMLTVNVSSTAVTEPIAHRPSNSFAWIRPAFYLNSNFFKNVKIDASKTGINVKNMLNESGIKYE